MQIEPSGCQGHADRKQHLAGAATRAFDKAALTITATTPEGRQGITTLNSKGRVIEIQEGDLAPVSYSYDARGRVTLVTEGPGASARTSTVTYDANGFVEKIENALGQETSFSRDQVGRVLSSILPDLSSIGFTYDLSGNLTILAPPGRGGHGFEYTQAEVVSKYDPPSAGAFEPSTSYSYNLDRQPTAVGLPGNRSVSFGYDTSGRLSTTSFSRGSIAYSYDSSSRLSRIEAPGAELITYGYDGDLLTSLTAEGTAFGNVAYGYNPDLRLSSRSINGGTATAFSHDKDGLLTAAESLSLSWDATNGHLNSTSTGGTTPVTTSHTYSSFGEPAGVTASYGSTQLYSVSFERDKLGRIVKKTETIGGVTSFYDYGYDSRGRLTEVKKDGASTHTFSYDANGNRIQETTPSATISATYDAQDRMTSYGGATYTYTANGELKTKTDSGGTTSYDYDELGNLVKVTLSNSTVIEYATDGLGRRIAKKVDGAITQRFLYGTGPLPVAELDASGNVISTFTYASKSHSPDLMTKGGATYRIVSDHLGSPRLVVNPSTGEIAQRIDYDAFGNVTQDTNSGFQPFGFAGGLYDRETKLVRFGVRDYDPQTGRWTAKDPIGFEGGDTNLYSYVGNDPVDFIDPTGNIQEDPAMGRLVPSEEWARISEWVDGAWGILQCADAALELVKAPGTWLYKHVELAAQACVVVCVGLGTQGGTLYLQAGFGCCFAGGGVGLSRLEYKDKACTIYVATGRVGPVGAYGTVGSYEPPMPSTDVSLGLAFGLGAGGALVGNVDIAGPRYCSLEDL